MDFVRLCVCEGNRGFLLCSLHLPSKDYLPSKEPEIQNRNLVSN